GGLGSTPRTTSSWLAFPQHESDSADGMYQPRRAVDIDFLTQPRHLHVDDVVERRGAARLLPHIAREHLTRDEVPLVPQEVFEQLELAAGQIDHVIAPHHAARDEIEFQIRGLQSKRL